MNSSQSKNSQSKNKKKYKDKMKINKKATEKKIHIYVQNKRNFENVEKHTGIKRK